MRPCMTWSCIFRLYVMGLPSSSHSSPAYLLLQYAKLTLAQGPLDLLLLSTQNAPLPYLCRTSSSLSFRSLLK